MLANLYSSAFHTSILCISKIVLDEKATDIPISASIVSMFDNPSHHCWTSFRPILHLPFACLNITRLRVYALMHRLLYADNAVGERTSRTSERTRANKTPARTPNIRLDSWNHASTQHLSWHSVEDDEWKRNSNTEYFARHIYLTLTVIYRRQTCDLIVSGEFIYFSSSLIFYYLIQFVSST